MSYTVKEVNTPVGAGRVFTRKQDPYKAGRLVIGPEEITAIESPELMLSSITQGLRDKGLVELLRGELKELTLAIYISYMRRWREASNDDWERLDFEIQIYRIAAFSSHDVTPEDIDDYFFEKIVEDAFSFIFRQKGGAGVKSLSQIINIVEEKHRYRTEEEDEFLHAVEIAAKEVDDLPQQKDVFKHWEHPTLRTSEETFRGIRDRLGFSWLPTGARGKNKL